MRTIKTTITLYTTKDRIKGIDKKYGKRQRSKVINNLIDKDLINNNK